MPKNRRERCPECGFLEVIKWGKRGGHQRYKCKNCGSLFTFTAKTSDYASRFRLVFSASDADGDADGDSTFAFVDASGNIVIPNANADAVLQIVDVMGRVIVSRGGHIQCVPTSGMTPGMYVLRLINGDDVKTQKIIIQ